MGEVPLYMYMYMDPFSLARRGPTKPRDKDVYRGTSLKRNRAPP